MPDKHGHFEEFGGKYVPETLIPALDELEQEYLKSKKDKNFQKEFYNAKVQSYLIKIMTYV